MHKKELGNSAGHRGCRGLGEQSEPAAKLLACKPVAGEKTCHWGRVGAASQSSIITRSGGRRPLAAWLAGSIILVVALPPPKARSQRPSPGHKLRHDLAALLSAGMCALLAAAVAPAAASWPVAVRVITTQRCVGLNATSRRSRRGCCLRCRTAAEKGALAGRGLRLPAGTKHTTTITPRRL